MNAFSTFAVTIRPRDGITDPQIALFTKFFCKGRTDFSYVVTEKTGDERHLHAALILKKSCTLSNFTTQVIRLYKDLDNDEKSNLRRGVKIWYNDDFLTYLKKGDDTVVIHSNLPEAGCLESYYPPKPLPKATQRNLNMHTTMIRYEALWREHIAPHVEVNTMNVRDFLTRMQYDVRVIGLMTDQNLIQHSKWFTRWMMKADACKISLPVFEKEEGPGFH